MQRVKAVIFDWAGTVIDHGSLAPMGAFVEAFAEFGIELTIADARKPMGMAKKPHIEALLRLPHIAQAWREKYSHNPDEADINAIYQAFLPKNIAVVDRYSALIEGTVEVVQALRAQGVKIGSSTGYTYEIMDRILPLAAAQGFTPDNVVCTGDTSEGRPSPLMLYKNMLDLNVWPAHCIVKVDDTVVGVKEGLNASAWAIGVSVSGNCFGLSLEDTQRLDAQTFSRKKADAEHILYSAGAHYVIESVADLVPVIVQINGRLARGERP